MPYGIRNKKDVKQCNFKGKKEATEMSRRAESLEMQKAIGKM